MIKKVPRSPFLVPGSRFKGSEVQGFKSSMVWGFGSASFICLLSTIFFGKEPNGYLPFKDANPSIRDQMTVSCYFYKRTKRSDTVNPEPLNLEPFIPEPLINRQDTANL